MRKFDTKVQYLKYKVLREVARKAWNGTLYDELLDIPKTIVPGKHLPCVVVFIKNVPFWVNVLKLQWVEIKPTPTSSRLLILPVTNALLQDLKLPIPAVDVWLTDAKMFAKEEP